MFIQNTHDCIIVKSVCSLSGCLLVRRTVGLFVPLSGCLLVGRRVGLFVLFTTCVVNIVHMIFIQVDYSGLKTLQKEKQKCKRSKYRARKKKSKRAAWLLENILKKWWKDLKQKIDDERELELRDAQRLAIEEYACQQEQKAEQIREQSESIKYLNSDYLDMNNVIKQSYAGLLNLPSYHPTQNTSSSMLQSTIHYRNLAEELR